MLTDNLTAPLILVVEDDYSHAELIRRSFEDASDEYRLEIADTLRDAKSAIERHSPGIVLTDYRLPDGNGSELIAMAAKSWPVIMMTAQGNELVAVETMKIGAQDYIVKSPEAFKNMSLTVKYALIAWSLTEARRQTDEAVFKAKKDWERTFDAVPDLISIIDLDHTILRANKAMSARCGVPLEEIVGRKCYEVMHGISCPHTTCPHIRMIQDGSGCSEQVEEKRLDGVFDISVAPLYDSEGRIYASVHIARDVTEFKRAEEMRLVLEAQFQQTQKLESIGVLAGGIAHDFNNILMIILGHCYMMKENSDTGISDKEHVSKIEAAGNRAAELCRQMLTYAGQSPLVQTRVNLWLLVDEVAKMLHATIKKNVFIERDLNRDVPELTGDKVQIQQIIMNLIINAAEAIGDNNGTVKIALKIAIIDAEHSETDFLGIVIPARVYACLEVSDTGCGIDEENQKRIFEPFFTTKFTGRGLGMSAIMGIIKSHDASLQLFSTPGVGTTFKVFFPLSAVQNVVETAPAVSFFPLTKISGTILLVDDEESLRSVGTELLSLMGFSAITATNGREALEIYRKQGTEIDLIMLDMLMPVMGGLEAYRILREISREIPIVICSGYSTEDILEEIDKDTYSSVIHKPYNMAQLQNTMMILLDKVRVETTGTTEIDNDQIA